MAFTYNILRENQFQAKLLHLGISDSVKHTSIKYFIKITK